MTASDSYYPLFLDLAGRRCVVVGGGAVAAGRVEPMVDRGAEVTVVAPELDPRLEALRDAGAIAVIARAYAPGDLTGALVAVVATPDPEVNAAVAADARAGGILVNVVDDAAASDFIVPSVLRRGSLQIAVSTGGAAPGVAKRVRQDLEPRFGEEWEAYLALLRDVRALARTRIASTDRRREVLAAASSLPLLERIRLGEPLDAEDVLAEAERMAAG